MKSFKDDTLVKLIQYANAFKQRDLYPSLMNYLKSNDNKFSILFGLRRTGKTVAMYQAINDLGYKNCKYILCQSDDYMTDLFSELDQTSEKYIFIDEITRIKDFIKNAGALSDIYTSSGKRIVVSGTDSLGFVFSKKCGQLLDRAILIRTTYILFSEWHRLLGKNLTEYIKYGGTLAPENTFYNNEVSTEYLDTSIINNFTHAIADLGTDAPVKLYTAYKQNELVSIIQKMIDMSNEQFLIDINYGDLFYITEDFMSHNFGDFKDILTRRNERVRPFIENTKEINEALRNALRIHNQSDILNAIYDPLLLKEIISYMKQLDIIASKNDVTKSYYFVQPGLRYSQCKALIESLYECEIDKLYSRSEWNNILSIYDTIVMGRILEDIIYTDISQKEGKMYNWDVRKYKKTIDDVDMEFDIAISDLDHNISTIIEIKHSSKAILDQAKNLNCQKLCNEFEKEMGTHIIHKIVIYNGSDTMIENIEYRNATDFLLQERGYSLLQEPKAILSLDAKELE